MSHGQGESPSQGESQDPFEGQVRSRAGRLSAVALQWRGLLVAGAILVGLFLLARHSIAFAFGIVLFVVGILISVILHEAGHFLTAKKFGMKATQFFVGFGPTLWSTTRGRPSTASRPCRSAPSCGSPA